MNKSSTKEATASPIVGIIRCDWLIDRESDGNLFYWDTFSPHLPAFDQVYKYLDNNRVEVKTINDDALEKPLNLLKKGIRILIVPRARRFYEKYFNGLVDFAKSGGTVIAIYPSFHWDVPQRDGNGWSDQYDMEKLGEAPAYPEECQDHRLAPIFNFEEMRIRKVWGKIVLQKNEFSWLWSNINTSGIIPFDDWAWIIVKPEGTRIGDLKIDKASKDGNGNDIWKSPLISPLVLIKEYEDTNGAFYYFCFNILHYFDKYNLGQVLLNIINERSKSEIGGQKETSSGILKQLTALQVMLVLAMIVIGLLISWIYFPPTDFSSILKTVVTTLLSGLVGLLIAQLSKAFNSSEVKK